MKCCAAIARSFWRNEVVMSYMSNDGNTLFADCFRLLNSAKCELRRSPRRTFRRQVRSPHDQACRAEWGSAREFAATPTEHSLRQPFAPEHRFWRIGAVHFRELWPPPA